MFVVSPCGVGRHLPVGFSLLKKNRFCVDKNALHLSGNGKDHPSGRRLNTYDARKNDVGNGTGSSALIGETQFQCFYSNLRGKVMPGAPQVFEFVTAE